MAEAQHKLAQLDFDRLSKLALSNAASQQELDSARQTLEVSAANVVVRQQERALLEADTSRKRRAEVIDHVAASYILQGALDRLSHLKANST